MHQRPRRSLESRFLGKINKDDNSKCWLWVGAKDSSGYGHIGSGGKNGKIIKAHRFSYLLYKGEIPDKICVLHKCDVPSCVNPEHLFLGTHQDNMQDRDKKGRQKTPTGVNHGRAVLNYDIVNNIRSDYGLNKYTLMELVKIYQLSRAHILQIISNKTWKDSNIKNTILTKSEIK